MRVDHKQRKNAGSATITTDYHKEKNKTEGKAGESRPLT